MAEAERIKLDVREDGIYLIIENPPDKQKVSRKDVLKLIEDCKVTEVDVSAVNAAFKDTSEHIELRITAQTKLQVKDESVSVEIARDKMSATVKFSAGAAMGKTVDLERLEKTIDQAGIRYGIDQILVKQLGAAHECDRVYPIAQGVEAVHGENGYLDYLFDTGDKTNRPKILEDGRVDFKQIDFFEQATIGQLLVTSVPPTVGADGKNVLGQVISHKPGKPAPKLPTGKGTVANEDDTKLSAAISGKVVLVNKKVSVLPILEIKGSVGNETGNVTFDGSVVIEGEVLTGFEIHATGNVDVKGSVEGAIIDAGGNIGLLGGVHGMNKAVITAGGDVFAKYIQNATVQCKGDILSDNILHSSVSCNGSIKMEGSRRLIVGGTVRVGREIFAGVIGSNMATPTDIGICEQPGAIAEYAQLREAHEKASKDYRHFTLAIDNLMKTADMKLLPQEKKDMLLKSLHTKAFLRDKMNEIQAEMDELRLSFVGNKGKLHASGVIHSGVDILIGDATIHVKDDIEACILQNVDGMIIIGAFKEA